MNNLKYNVVDLYCIYCGNKFYRWRDKGKGKRASGIRTTDAITCCKECSRNYSKLRIGGKRKQRHHG